MKTCLLCEGVTETEQELCSACGTPLLATSEVHFPLRRGEEDAAHPLLGTLIDGKYRVAGVLGKGGMGTVFRAVHEVSLVPVALKILHPRFAQKPEHRAYFLAEARKAGRVVHESCARIQDVGEAEDGTVYLAMELVQGLTLHEWMRAEPPPPELVVEILYQICGALAAAHDVGLVHRDLTPKNIMVVARDGLPAIKILDFGIAKGPRFRSDLRDSFGAPAGFANPPYSAPEHLLGEEVDARADLYSVGVLAYEMLAGRPPVEGESPSELARATIAGRILPMSARKKTPQALVRLIESLLARNVRSRPASANEVKRALTRLREPPAAWLGPVSVLATVAGLGAVAFAWANGPAPFLNSSTGSVLVIRSTPSGRDDPPMFLRTEQLAELHFDYGGFVPGQLRLDVQQGPAAPVASVRLRPKVPERRGHLVLAAADDADLSTLWYEVAERSRNGPVDLVFALPERAPLGYARIVVDDDPPRVSLAVEHKDGETAGILRGQSILVVSAEDAIGLGKVELVVTAPALGAEKRIELVERVELGAQRKTALALLKDVLPGVHSYSEVGLVVVAVDRASNRAESAALRPQRVDLRVSEIVSASAPEGGATLTIGPAGARLRIGTEAADERLTVLVQPPSGPEESYEAEQADARDVEVTLRPRSDGTLPDGGYTLRLRDAAGNVSGVFRKELQFRTEEPLEALRVGDESAASASAPGGPFGRVAMLGKRVVTDGSPARVELGCNPLYRPLRARLQSVRPPDAPQLEPGPDLGAAGWGAARIVLPALASGEYRLTIELADRREKAPSEKASREIAFDVIALKEPLVLQLPDVRGKRFLHELESLNALRRSGESVLPGSGWRLLPADARLVHGAIYHGSRDLVMTGTTAPEARDAPLLGQVPLLRGENALALALADPLERPVGVQIGERPAELVQAGDKQASLIARFWFEDAAPQQSERPLRFEHGLPARLRLRSPLPFRDGDRLELVVDGAPVPAESVRGVGVGVELEFKLQFERLVAAAKLSDLDAKRYEEQRVAVAPALLRTPAGDFELELAVRTSRSVLKAVSLGEIASSDARARLPMELQQIRMVPVPRPLMTAWPDPVPVAPTLLMPKGLPSRDGFRPDPPYEVRGIGTTYLQRGEVTRGQHDAVVRAFLSLPLEQRPDWRRFVHAYDPLGKERLTDLNLRPRLPQGGLEAQAAWVRLGPARALTGLDWYQAYAITRIAAFLLGDAELLRLPLGVELEWAALGGDGAARGKLHGAVDPDARLAAAHAAAAQSGGEPRLWPPSEQDSEDRGDFVITELGDRIVALDFGVREWTLDLQYVQDPAHREVIREWLADATRHLEQAMEFARGNLRAAVGPLLALNGAARGLALGELPELGDAASRSGRPLDPLVPGVVRVIYLRRDGEGLLPKERHPRLGQIGLRLCGGEAFVMRTRETRSR